MSTSSTSMPAKSSKKKQKQQAKKGGGKGQAEVSNIITPRATDYSQWYQDVVYSSELVDQSPVRGCMVIRPWGMAVWDFMRDDLDKRIKSTGVQNAYFPLMIPTSFLSKEADHVDGFAKECAVITHHRLCANPEGGGLIPDPSAKLEEPLVVRPTSETIIWNMFGKWIDSYRDLPLKLNQWANVVRWEFRTRPFLRSSEFLWQEGHTAHSSRDEAFSCAKEMLDVYADFCKDMLAVPVVKGLKSESERFAGADETLTIEALMQNGWALQSGTSHFLGQNFARAFDVEFQDTEGGRELVWATSWGVSTRLIGAMVMTHADDAGLVLPPPIAPVQIVVIPILGKTEEDEKQVRGKVTEAVDAMKAIGLRVTVDDRTHIRPGAKFFEWERKGTPLRIEVGPRDVANGVAVVKTRLGEKTTVPLGESFADAMAGQLDEFHEVLLASATTRLEEKTYHLTSYDEMKVALQSSESTGFYLVPWNDNADNEAKIKEETKATIRCYPIDSQAEAVGKACFYSGEPATHMAIFARAF